MEIILAKMGEMVLKGLNRRNFEDALMRNLRYRLQKLGEFSVYSAQSTVYIEPKSEAIDMAAAERAAARVFGIASLCRAFSSEKELGAIERTAAEKLAPALESARSFKVESKRADKSFPLGSPEISREVGGRLHDRFPNLKVDVHAPEVTVYVEIRDYAAYVHTDPVPGAGGLPVGTGGGGLLLLSGGIDSPVAGYMMAKRGLRIEAVHFDSYPYTTARSKEKVMALAKELTPYCGTVYLAVVPFTKIQERIRDGCPDEYVTLLMRRFMMRIAERLARQRNLGCLITGESLGQVASQTVQALGVTGGVCALPVFRPLIGFDKEEIVRLSRKIGTYETSVLPYEDCCTVFTPKRPKTKPRARDLEKIEEGFDIDGLVAEAADGTERLEMTL